ncbi:hypothetical protein [Actinomadura formosensis]|uniref:hypothetical protein n=1 Tax=Actinomadura formosensis TaxID=60706 RepID=UPI003D8ECB3A
MSEPIEYGVKRLGVALPVSRELLIEHGVMEPTDAERAELERLKAQVRRREQAHARAQLNARRRLAAIADPLARAVLDLHAENERGECTGDDMEGYEAEYPAWPCRTVKAVAAHYGIPL